MTATKTNERPGTRASVRYARVSPSKARVVLDLIRGEPVSKALEILDFTERDVAEIIRKCLESAVANAEHNDGQSADELKVAACYADEGPTLKRWRPRARGRATRINKRTSHITIIVARMDDAELELLRQRESAGARGGSGRTAADARRQRVAKSREAKAEREAAEEAAEAEAEAAEATTGEDAATAAEDSAEAGIAEAAEPDAGDEASDVGDAESVADTGDDEPEASETAAEDEADADDDEKGQS